MAAKGGITDETCNYMLKLEVTSKSKTFNKIQLMQKFDKAATEENTVREAK